MNTNQSGIITTQKKLTEEERKIGRKFMIIDGIFSQVMASLTTGVFLVALAVGLGASNAYIGVLTAIPAFSQVLQIPGVILVKKIANRKKITVGLALFGRLLLPLVALIPLISFQFPQAALFVFISIQIASALGASVSGIGWNSWIRDLINEKELGEFFSKKVRYSVFFGLITSFSAAFVIDNWQQWTNLAQIWVYSIFFSLASVIGLLGVLALSRVPEPPLEDNGESMTETILKPFRDKNFRTLMTFTGIWHFAANLTIPFFSVYMLSRLNYEVGLVTVLLLTNDLLNIIFVRIWGNFSDVHNNKTVLRFCIPLMLLTLFLWTFTTLPDPHRFTFPLVVFLLIMSGIAMSGINLSLGNISFKLAPRGQGASYMAGINLFNSLTAGIAPIIGGSFIDLFSLFRLRAEIVWTSPTREIDVQTLSFESWDFFFFIAILFGLIALIWLDKVHEDGNIPSRRTLTKELMLAMRQEISFTTMNTLKSVISGPVIVKDVFLVPIKKMYEKYMKKYK